MESIPALLAGLEEDLEANPDGGPGLDPVHKRPVEWFEEENWFFRLSAFEQPLLDWFAWRFGRR
jgi:methionyl-tRNA synthetase